MLRRLGALAAILLLLGSVVTLTLASVPKVVVFENFGAVW